ncbi:transcriptional regulator of RNA polII, SAGA, subunit-domain-containing protein [Pavlovales sp. CCMP2436]|nr:transcriptional regulator of RNA polII, SAGA, subunit-domain-containing protein [Pavlovales sp. CCMP2436]|mmetsp:Transcript_7379/g.19209  ORF Transcript_7379/g.19209 Transcript_7379/m.19209 type:complete len:315 (+) Transcript_7379:20-964(+)
MGNREGADEGASVRVRDELLGSLGDARGARYWVTLRSFIAAKLSKSELDAVLRETLSEEQLAMHNELIRAILGSAARTLPSVRDCAKAGGTPTPLGLWGSARPAVPMVLHPPVGPPSLDVALAMPRVFPNRLKPGVAVRVLPPSRGRVRSCAFSHPPSASQILALRRRVLTLLPNEAGAPREVSEDGLLMLSQALQCHMRSLLGSLVLARQGAEPAPARGVGQQQASKPPGAGAISQRPARRISMGELHEALTLSRRVSTAASWQLPLCWTTPPARWATTNLELVRAVGGPHAPFITPPMQAAFSGDDSSDEWD